MPPVSVTCQPTNVTTTDAANLGEDDLNALLYIVVTLLFYSMGIVIGIITYLKREQAEMEEDKMFEVYLHMKREPQNLHKQERVNQMALYLKQLEDRKSAQEQLHYWDGSGSDQNLQPHQHHPLCPHHDQQHQLSGSQQHLDPLRSQPMSGPCSLCHHHTSSLLADPHSHAHLDPHHLQPLTSRSRHSSGRETPAGTPALLCSLTLNVCEPFLSPESLPKAALPFKPPMPRDGGSIFYPTSKQTIIGSDNGRIKPSAFPDDNTAGKPAAGTSRLGCAGSDNGTVTQQTLPLHDHDNKEKNSHTICCGMSDMGIELQQLRREMDSASMQTAPLVFPKLPEESQVIAGLLEARTNNECDRCTIPPHVPRPFSLSSTSSPPVYARSISSDNAVAPAGRNRLQRQLSLHNDHTSVSPRTHKALSGLHKERIQEQDSTSTGFRDSDTSVACDSENESLNLSHTSACRAMVPEGTNYDIDNKSSIDTLSRQHKDNRLSGAPLEREESSSLSSIPVSHSDSPLQEKGLQSLNSCTSAQPTTRPLDARPKIYNVLGGSDSGELDTRQLPAEANTPPGHGRSKLRRVVLEAWRKNSPQSVDIPDSSRLQKKSISNLPFPALTKVKGHVTPQEATRSTFPRAPSSRDERRGALFLSQKSLLQASGAGPKQGAGNRSGPHARTHRGILPRQVSLDSSSLRPAHLAEFSQTPLLEPTLQDTLEPLDLDATMSGEDTVSPMLSAPQGTLNSRIPKLSRARTVDIPNL